MVNQRNSNRNNGRGGRNYTPRRPQGPIPRPMAAMNMTARSQQQTSRNIWTKESSTLQLSQASTQNEVAGPPANTKYVDFAVSFALEDFFDSSTNAYLSTVDAFKFQSVDIYLDVSNMPFNSFFRRFKVWYKADFDDNNTVAWPELQKRDNVMSKIINPIEQPRIKLMTIVPNADNRSTATGSGPENAIFNRNMWYDTSAIQQRFVGLKVHVEVNSGASETFTPTLALDNFARILFRGQV